MRRYSSPIPMRDIESNVHNQALPSKVVQPGVHESFVVSPRGFRNSMVPTPVESVVKGVVATRSLVQTPEVVATFPPIAQQSSTVAVALEGGFVQMSRDSEVPTSGVESTT